MFLDCLTLEDGIKHVVPKRRWETAILRCAKYQKRAGIKDVISLYITFRDGSSYY